MYSLISSILGRTVTTFVNGIVIYPWRYFFPLGLVGGSLGVSFWTFSDISMGYAFHGLVMVGAFLFPMASGFLMYAGPRFLNARPSSRIEGWLLLGSIVGMLISILLENLLWYLIGFGILLAIQNVFILSRVIPRKAKLPFIPFLVIGFMQAWIGILLLLLIQLYSDSMQAHLSDLIAISRSILLHGSFWLIFMGLGIRLFPMISLSLNAHTKPEKLHSWVELHPSIWTWVAILFSTSYTFATGIYLEIALWFRFALMMWIAWQGWLLFQSATRKGVLVFFLKSALWISLLGHLLLALYPQHYKDLSHLIFAAGYGIGALGVMTRVLLSHEKGNLERERDSKTLALAFSLILLAALVRTCSIFVSDFTIAWKISASLFLVGLGVWMGGVFLALKSKRVKENE